MTGLSVGFGAIAASDATLLILGSLPGRISLREEQYYAHPRNAFWSIMDQLFGISGNYDARCKGLRQNKIALWDVLRASRRPGSLDANIRTDTAVANNFAAFLSEHVSVVTIAFNGRKAEQLFRRFVKLDTRNNLRYLSLPSTSPAYAAMSFSTKLEIWRENLTI